MEDKQATSKGMPTAVPAQERDKPTKSRRSGETAPSKAQRFRRYSVAPYNPSLQRLVEGKQAWAEPLDPPARTQGFIGWHQRGYLPHRDNRGLNQFVTFRLLDGLPASRRGEWEALLGIEDNRQRRTRLEEYLDRGYGECWLGQPPIAALAEAALRHFNSERYQLLAWVIMLNHVHVLVQVWETPLARVVQSWKGFIAREANKLLKREGSFWEREYWDTYMRDEAQLIKATSYIEQNPVKARLVTEAKARPWSSARFRGLYGQLEPMR
jgi:putative transposase